MVGLKILGSYLDLFPDETIDITSKIKDVRDIDKVFTSFSRSFKLPASKKNNIFFNYYHRYYVDGIDARYKVPAQLEIDTVPFIDGFIKLNFTSLKLNEVDTYDVTFFGNVVNLSDRFAELTLNDLDFGEYNHVKNEHNVTLGLDGGFSLLNDKVIYPLITKENQWTQAQLESGSDISFNEFFPAIKVNEVLKVIKKDFGLTFNSHYFDSAQFNKLYLLAQRKLPDAIAKLISKFGVLITYDTTDNPGLITLSGAYILQSNVYEGDLLINITTTSSDPYDVVLVDGTNNEVSRETKTGNSIVDFSLFGGFYRVYIQAATEIQMSISTDLTTFDIDNYPLDSGTATKSNIKIVDYNSIFKYKLPEIKVKDFFTSLLKIGNLIVEGMSGTTFDIMPYDDWIALGEVKDLTKYIDITKHQIITPKLPREISFSYLEPKSINNNKYFEYNGYGYGDLINREIAGEDEPIEFKPLFENLMWDRLTGSDFHVGFVFDKSEKPIEEIPFLMYYDGSQTANIDLKDMAAITSYKICSSYFPLTSPTDTLNFGSEINSWDLTEESVSLYKKYYDNLIKDVFSKARRMYKFNAILSAPTIYHLKLNDTVKLRDDYYLINSINSNLNTKRASLELINITRTSSTIQPPQPIPPAKPEVKDRKTLIDSVILDFYNVAASGGVANIELYRDGNLIQTLGSTVTTYTDTGLSVGNNYDYYIKTVDNNGLMTSSDVITVTIAYRTLDMTVIGHILRGDACSDNVNITRYHVGTGTGVSNGDTIYTSQSGDKLVGSGKFYGEHTIGVTPRNFKVNSSGVVSELEYC